MGGFPKIKGTLLGGGGGPGSKDYSNLGSILKSLLLGICHMSTRAKPEERRCAEGRRRCFWV